MLEPNLSVKDIVGKRKLLREETEIFALLQQSYHAIARIGQNEIRPFGITMTQASLLFVVKAIDGPATLSEISRWLFRERHTVFVMLKEMEKQGLVKRLSDLKRKRMFRVVLTEQGEEAYRWVMTKENVIPDVIACLSPEERSCLRASLEKLRNIAMARLGVRRPLPLP